MSVRSVGGSSTTLQKQLHRDQTTLARDRSGSASQQVLAMDQARVALDQANIAAAVSQQAQTAKSAQTSHAPGAPAPGVTPTPAARTESHAPAAKVDLYL